MADNLDKTTDLSTDIYGINNYVNQIKKDYNPDLNEDTLMLGIYGYLGQIFSDMLQNTVVMASEFSNESIPTKAKFEKNIIAHALGLGITDINAAPSQLDVLLTFVESDIVEWYNSKNAQKGDGGWEFIFDKDTPIYIGDFCFHTDYDIKIKKVYIKSLDKYTYTAQYIFDIDNPISDLTNPYLSPPVEMKVNGGTKVIFTKCTLHQVEKETIYKTILSDNSITAKTTTFDFSGQLAAFTIDVREGNSTNVTHLIPVYEGLQVEDTKYPHFYYSYLDSNTIRIKFDRSSYAPRINCEVKINLQTTQGTGGNFTFDPEVFPGFSFSSDKYGYSNIGCEIRPITGEAAYGSDKKTVADLQKLIPKEALSRGSITNIADLENFFNMLNTDDSKLYVYKKRDNALERLYYSFILMRDAHNVIIPTNTIDLKVLVDDLETEEGSGKLIFKKGQVIELGENFGGIDKEESPEVYKEEYYIATDNITKRTGPGLSYDITGTPVLDPISVHSLSEMPEPTASGVYIQVTKINAHSNNSTSWYFSVGGWSKADNDPIVYNIIEEDEKYSYDKDSYNMPNSETGSFLKVDGIWYEKTDTGWIEASETPYRIVKKEGYIYPGNMPAVEIGTYVKVNESWYIFNGYVWVNSPKYVVQDQHGNIVSSHDGGPSDTGIIEAGKIFSIMEIDGDFGKVKEYQKTISNQPIYLDENGIETVEVTSNPVIEEEWVYMEKTEAVNVYYQIINTVNGQNRYGNYSAAVGYVFEKGYLVKISAIDGEWYYVEDAESWIHASNITEANLYHVIADSVIVRERPNSYSNQVGEPMEKGDVCNLLATSNLYKVIKTETDIIDYPNDDESLNVILRTAKKNDEYHVVENIIVNELEWSLVDVGGYILTSDLDKIVPDMTKGDIEWANIAPNQWIPLGSISEGDGVDIVDTKDDNCDCDCYACLYNKANPNPYNQNFTYTIPYNFVINTSPLYGMYSLSIIDADKFLDFTEINENSIYQYVATSIHMSRGYNNDPNTYYMDIKMEQNIDTGTSNPMVIRDDYNEITRINIKCIAVFYNEDGDPYRWAHATAESTYTDSGSENVDIFKAQFKFETEDYMDSDNRLRIDSGMYITKIFATTTVESPGYVFSNMKCELYILCKPEYDEMDSTPQPTEYLGKLSEILDPSVAGIEGYVLTNIYTVVDGVDFFYDFSDIVGSTVIFEQDFNDLDENGMPKRYYKIKGVPVIRNGYFQTEDRALDFCAELVKRKNYIDYAVDVLEDAFEMDFKFFNTYGPSKLFALDEKESISINKTNINLTFKIRLKPNYDTNILNSIKDDIKTYVEDIDEINSLHMPNLITDITNKYEESIIYFEFVDMNGYGPGVQHVYKTDMPDSVMVPEFLNIDTSLDNGTPDITLIVM